MAVMPDSLVYLDNAAPPSLDERVLEAMLPYLRRGGPNGLPRGNPSSLHASGTAARQAVEEARTSVARLVGASPGEILFPAGGTEADNLAVLGLAAASRDKRHAVISAVEHPAVREAAAHLEAAGYELTRVRVDANGLIDPEELADLCRGAEVPFHVDAVQAAGRLDIDVSQVPISTLALSAHKFYGPQGVGALYVRDGVSLFPVLFGGGQEKGLRSGTENVAGIVGLGESARVAAGDFGERTRHEEALQDALLSGLTGIPGVRLNGHREKRLSNNIHLSV